MAKKIMFKFIDIGEHFINQGVMCIKHSRHTADVYADLRGVKFVGRYWFRYRDMCEPVINKPLSQRTATHGGNDA
jgi:hypothetical protein